LTLRDSDKREKKTPLKRRKRGKFSHTFFPSSFFSFNLIRIEGRTHDNERNWRSERQQQKFEANHQSPVNRERESVGKVDFFSVWKKFPITLSVLSELELLQHAKKKTCDQFMM
jgi:hypothetical protein